MCLNTHEFAYFLNLIDAKKEWISETLLIVYATAGDVYWTWTGHAFCASVGSML